ncbi:MAG: undecaprenyldiphospho-muramoylpentapeptide beta-N-acetylglucosaminyltransferase [Candidatus Margulisiibacteriota bacterium]
MKIAIVAGGTGGHIYPGLALACELRKIKPEIEILFLGSEEGLEKELVPRENFKIKIIKARALLRKFSYRSVSAPFVSVIGFFQALRILYSFHPSFLVSFGGYVSFPVVAAAKLLGIPILIHEQNVLPGIVNRLLARWARQVFLSFEESKKYFSFDQLKGYVVGNPIRPEIVSANREDSRKALGFTTSDFVVLVMGGSQGARKINEVLLASLPLIEESNLSHLKILHIVGKRDISWIDEALATKSYPFYKKVDYLYNVAGALAAADLVVSRAGATAIAEFLARGLPMILIPFPYSAENHQKLNARVVAEHGAAVVIENDQFTKEKLFSIICELKPRLKELEKAAKKMAKLDAARKIADWIFAYERN